MTSGVKPDVVHWRRFSRRASTEASETNASTAWKREEGSLGQWHDIRRLRESKIEAAVAMASAAMVTGMFFRPEEYGPASECIDDARVLPRIEVNSLHEDQGRRIVLDAEAHVVVQVEDDWIATARRCSF